ncbi:MAG TPA: hypothetical protein VFX76_10270 [Roseiflexaceae bacterium]|nr:hypothetical protein [Roseiflexaceae bacterium]
MNVSSLAWRSPDSDASPDAHFGFGAEQFSFNPNGFELQSAIQAHIKRSDRFVSRDLVRCQPNS